MGPRGEGAGGRQPVLNLVFGWNFEVGRQGPREGGGTWWRTGTLNSPLVAHPVDWLSNEGLQDGQRGLKVEEYAERARSGEL